MDSPFATQIKAEAQKAKTNGKECVICVAVTAYPDAAKLVKDETVSASAISRALMTVPEGRSLSFGTLTGYVRDHRAGHKGLRK
jgi:hypothetical protein